MDPVILEKHLVYIAECVRLLRERAHPGDIASDPVQFHFVVHVLQTAAQAAQDIASMIVSQRGLGEPRTNKELFQRLAQDGWISTEDAEAWRQIIAFRNIVVHRYLQVDAAIVRQIAERRTEDLMRFVRLVRARLLELDQARS
jgi:uncharacterized protein YutE (UPF0331/DUF86 family)